MEILSVYDPLFKHYGQIVTGMDESAAEITEALSCLPVTEAVGYVPSEPTLQSLSATEKVRDNLFGGMPVQMGRCFGHNTRLNCLEYHRDSEFNLGTHDFILLVARQDEIEDGVLDTVKVRAFRVPAGVMVECFATTLHYAPCHTDPTQGFNVLIGLPAGTNTEKPVITPCRFEDRLLLARNKWLLAHPDSPEAHDGAYVGLKGENIDIADLI